MTSASGSVGRSGRIILKSIPPGRHVLRVYKPGELDDERIVETGVGEQIIEAQLRPDRESMASSFGASERVMESSAPEIAPESSRATAPIEMPRADTPTRELPPLLETIPAPQPAFANAGIGSAPTFGDSRVFDMWDEFPSRDKILWELWRHSDQSQSARPQSITLRMRS